MTLQVPVQFTLAVPDQVISDIACTALECEWRHLWLGSYDLMHAGNPERLAALGDDASRRYGHLAAGGALLMRPPSGGWPSDQTFREVRLDAERLTAALTWALSGGLEIPGWPGDIEDVACHIDESLADSLMQYAVMGEVVIG